MLKKLIVKLKSIQYSGKSIGDDVRLEILILDKPYTFKRKFKSGTTVDVDGIIGEFFTSKNSFEEVIDLKVIEEDRIFSDVGMLSKLLKVDTTTLKTLDLSYEIVVKELRVRSTKTKAIFKIDIEVAIIAPVRYIEPTHDGWVVGKRADNDAKIDLPSYLRVMFERKKSEREYFTILEGINRGLQVSIPLKQNKNSYSLEGFPYAKAAILQYSKSSKILTIAGKKFQTTDDEQMLWEKGNYDVEIPDWAHRLGQTYKSESQFTTCWFRVGHSGERYIHTGNHSRGCITIIEHKKFDEVYKLLARCRKGDDMSVGVLTVVN